MLLLLPQRYVFSSKSQPTSGPYSLLTVVVATTKVRIFKQITTTDKWFRRLGMLLLLPQRYVFSSKSQHMDIFVFNLIVVVATTKVRIFKQITTYSFMRYLFSLLLLLPQRYVFSSKSQLVLILLLVTVVVVATTKVRIFKQITTFFSL